MDYEKLIILIAAIFHVIQAVVGGLIAFRRGKTFWIWFGICFFLIFPIGWICMFMGTKDDSMP